MQPSILERISAREGHSLLIDSLHQPRPWFPSLDERALLVRSALPPWAIASGITAGWVWTGMGNPEPWSVLRAEKPGLSPLERVVWQARIRIPKHDDITVLQGLTLLTPYSTVREILLGGGNIDRSATQLLLLTTDSRESLRSRWFERRASEETRSHAELILTRLEYLRETYPDITRYTS